MENRANHIDEKIQAMSLSNLKAIVGESMFVPTGVENNSIEEEITDEDAQIQNLSLADLKKVVNAASASLSIEEKSLKTGLASEIISKIEKDKNKATLEELMAYCQGLQIAYKDFLPELF